MPRYFTTEDLRISAQELASQRFQTLSEAFANTEIVKQASSRKLGAIPDEPAAIPPVIFDIFLSHSSLDAIQVIGLHRLLTSRGYAVYVDRICDPQLDRSKITRETCRVLRYRIAQSRSLFVATTQNSIRSSWVPWELGWMDGWNNKAAVLPVLQPGTSFAGQEFFELYPEIRFDPTYAKPMDLDVFEKSVRVASWQTWLGMSRKF